MHHPGKNTKKFLKNYPTIITSTIARADKSALVTSAVEAIRSGKFSSTREAGREFKVHHTIVTRRLNGRTKTRREAQSFYYQALTDSQEELLIAQINKLTNRKMLSTSQIVKNFAEEIRGRSVGKNWTSGFVQRYKLKLKSTYLRNIDNLRSSAEQVGIFIMFFTLVKFLFILILIHLVFY
ncbi:hypothetical protein BDZ45DRAFT_784518 [Acephala macrosclerotiorum]|nr:hypothetical protein BDZ45DRAFT_784518 [Acephala macrosclerotiorum]